MYNHGYFSGNRYAPVVYVKKGYFQKYQDLIPKFRGEFMSCFGDFNHNPVYEVGLGWGNVGVGLTKPIRVGLGWHGSGWCFRFMSHLCRLAASVVSLVIN